LPCPRGRVRTSVIVCISVLYLLCSVARKVLPKLDWTADTRTEVQRNDVVVSALCAQPCGSPALSCPLPAALPHLPKSSTSGHHHHLLITATNTILLPPHSSINCMILSPTPQLTCRLLPCTVGQGLHQQDPPSPTGSARIVRPRARQPWFTQPKTCASSASTREPDPSLRASTETELRELQPTHHTHNTRFTCHSHINHRIKIIHRPTPRALAAQTAWLMCVPYTHTHTRVPSDI